MKMYRCEICRAIFDEPLVINRSEVLDSDGNRERRREVLCPSCGVGERYFSEVKKEEYDDT